MRAECHREARRLGASPELADDAAQEAAIRAWRCSKRCRTPNAPLPWVRQIARNETFRLLARSGRELALNGEVETVTTIAPTEVVAGRVDVGRAIQRLPATDRLLVILRYGADLPQHQIAEMLSMPEGTVKVRLHRIRHKLAPALKA